MINGIGFPAYTGGPLWWADSIGLQKIVAAMRGLRRPGQRRMDPGTAARAPGRVRRTLLPGLSGRMNFDHSPKTLALLARLRAFMDEHIYPNETRYHEQLGGDRWTKIPLLDELSQHARAAGLWNLFLPPAAGRDGSHQRRVRAALRSHGTCALVLAGVQLLGAGHRQHGDAGPLRHAGAAAAVARAAAGRSHPLGIRNDRARGRVERRHQHRDVDPAQRIRLRHQRPQVVDLRCGR